MRRNLLTKAEVFDRLNTGACRRSTAYRWRSFHCQIRMSRPDNDDSSHPALMAKGSHKSVVGIPSSNNQIRHTKE